MNKEVLFLILDDYADWESAYLSSAIREMSKGEVTVKTVSLSLNPIKTIGGFTTLPDYDLTTVPSDFAALFLIGGYSWVKEEANKVLPFVRAAIADSRLVGGICAASEFMAANGFLNNCHHTSNGLDSIAIWNEHQYTNNKLYKNEQAVIDCNIITANGSATLDFARLALKALKIVDDSNIDEWYKFNSIGYVEFMKSYVQKD